MPIPLSSFPRPAFDTGLGVHGGPNISFPMGENSSDWSWWADELRAMGVSWIKLLSGGTSALDCATYFLEQGFMPVVRIYRPGPNPGTMVDDDPAGRDAVAQFVARGIRYFEVNNEPGLYSEWAGDLNGEGVPYSWQNVNPNQPIVVADSWIRDAEFVIAQGGFPAVPAMAPGGDFNDIDWLRIFFQHIKDVNKASIMAMGVWLSVHPAAFNHDINYPHDPANQQGVPVTQAEYDQHEWAGSLDWVNAERVRGKNPGQTLLSVNANGNDIGASNGWLKWRAVGDLFYEYFGFHVPVIGTEGGWWPNMLQDPRYFKTTKWDVSYNTRLAAEAMMRGDYPGWFFATGHWLLASKGMGGSMEWEKDVWYSPVNGNAPVIDNLKAMVKIAKPAPADDEPIPPESTILTDAEIAEVTAQAGFTGAGWTTAVAIVLAESGGDTQAVNEYGNDPAGSRDRGLWQLNSYWHSEISDECAFDALCSSTAAYGISDGGTDWVAWSAYNAGTYMDYWGRAEAVTCGSQLPSEEELRKFAWESCIGVPEDAALMKEGRRLGLVPICGEGRDMIGCGPYVGQCFTNADGAMVLLYCRDEQWDKVYRQDL